MGTAFQHCSIGGHFQSVTHDGQIKEVVRVGNWFLMLTQKLETLICQSDILLEQYA